MNTTDEPTFRLINWCLRCTNVTMADVVRGHRCPRRAPRFLAAALILAAAVGAMGCATALVAAPVEAVGVLAPSYHSVAVAPVKHDAPPEFAGVVDSGDDAGEVVETVTRAPQAAELPEVAPKTDGITTGPVRQ